MGWLSWFRESTRGLYCAAIEAVNRWWDSIDSKPYGMLYEVNLGKVSFFLYGSDEVARSKWKEKHGTEIPSTLGTCWVSASNNENLVAEIWLPLKYDKDQGYILNPWGAGHELRHLLAKVFEYNGWPQLYDGDEV
jgi:hypothetical protein